MNAPPRASPFTNPSPDTQPRPETIDPGRWIDRVLDRAADRAGGDNTADLRASVERAELELIDAAPPNTDWAQVARVHEQLLASALTIEDGAVRARPLAARDRRTRGVYYTPPAIVEHLLETAASLTGAPPRSVADPACGAGGFLEAARRRWPDAALVGVDTDPVACAIAQRRVPGARILMADALALDRKALHADAGAHGGFDLIASNPPFQSQLAAATASTRDRASALAVRTDGLVRGYADTAAAFLLEALALARPGGVAAMVMPMSLLGARDTAPLRAHIGRQHTLEHLWVSREPAFDGGVRVCAVVVRTGRDTRDESGRARITRAAGVPPKPIAPAVRTVDHDARHAWGPLIADAWSIPRVELVEARTIADLAEVTADFRDEYYALRGLIREAAAGDPDDRPDDRPDGRPDDQEALVPLVTSGLIDPARCIWGVVPAILHRQRFARPTADARELPPKARAWAQRRLVPKLLLATQSRVIEAAADPRGLLLPVTPVLSVMPREPADLWRLGAVLTSPATAASAAARALGSSLSGDAIKLSAAQVRALPVPAPCAALDEAARFYRDACEASGSPSRDEALLSCARRVLDAQGVTGGRESLLSWWSARLPRRAGDRGGARA